MIRDRMYEEINDLRDELRVAYAQVDQLTNEVLEAQEQRDQVQSKLNATRFEAHTDHMSAMAYEAENLRLREQLEAAESCAEQWQACADDLEAQLTDANHARGVFGDMVIGFISGRITSRPVE